MIDWKKAKLNKWGIGIRLLSILSTICLSAYLNGLIWQCWDKGTLKYLILGTWGIGFIVVFWLTEVALLLWLNYLLPWRYHDDQEDM